MATPTRKPSLARARRSLAAINRKPTINEPIRFDPFKAKYVTVERFTVNVTKARVSPWHLEGNWPSKRYYLQPLRRDRFADRGDTVEHVILERYRFEYANCLKYERVKLIVVDRFTL